jgi:hypothetical protein
MTVVFYDAFAFREYSSSNGPNARLRARHNRFAPALIQRLDMKNTASTSNSTWDLPIPVEPVEPVESLISRSTILILCGILAGVLLSFQLSIGQRTVVAGSCLVGIIAFLTLGGGISNRILSQNRRLRETRAMLNRRIDLQLAFLDAQVRESLPIEDQSEQNAELVGTVASQTSGNINT